jgi:hypothetical protein
MDELAVADALLSMHSASADPLAWVDDYCLVPAYRDGRSLFTAIVLSMEALYVSEALTGPGAPPPTCVLDGAATSVRELGREVQAHCQAAANNGLTHFVRCTRHPIRVLDLDESLRAGKACFLEVSIGEESPRSALAVVATAHGHFHAVVPREQVDVIRAAFPSEIATFVVPLRAAIVTPAATAAANV